MAAQQSKPYLIGIAGPSCAGKTELARRLASALGAPILPTDSYYRDLSHLPFENRCGTNFDVPDSLDHDLLFRHIALLAEGREIQKPVYDFTRHVRAAEIERLRPGKFLIVEGLFALYWEDIRELLGTKVFVTAPDPLCYERRRERDVRERGRTVQSVEEQYRLTVRPMAEQYILPTREFADVVVSGTDPLEGTAALVLAHIEQSLGKGVRGRR